MDQATDGGEDPCCLGKDIVPAQERVIGGNGDTDALVCLGDPRGQHAGFRLVAPDAAHIVEDSQIEAVEFGQFSRQPSIAARGLQWLHRIAGTATRTRQLRARSA